MESRIPLPTDNVFKFYALFGLLLFIFSIGSVLYVNQSANERFYTLYPQLEGLKQVQEPTSEEQARIAILERSLQVSKSDKTFFMQILGGMTASAICIALFGFYKWEKELQPIQDRASKAQAEMAELQLLKLKREMGMDDKVEAAAARPEITANSTTEPPAAQSSSTDDVRPQGI